MTQCSTGKTKICWPIEGAGRAEIADIAALGGRRSAEVARFLSEHAELLARQGAVTAAWRRRGDRQAGPYYSLVCRDADGRQRSVYLGRAGALVDAVRRAVAELQAPLRERRRLAQICRTLRREAAAARRQLDEELRPLGLRRQGHEIRGWSQRPAQRPARGESAAAAVTSEDLAATAAEPNG